MSDTQLKVICRCLRFCYVCCFTPICYRCFLKTRNLSCQEKIFEELLMVFEQIIQWFVCPRDTIGEKARLSIRSPSSM